MSATDGPRPAEGYEIERRFLCRRPAPSLLDAADAAIPVRQGYLATEGATVRVRLAAGRRVLTVKSGEGRVRREVELELSGDVGDALMEMCGSRIVEKTRYVVGRWEVDVFRGALEGLVLAEVELESEGEPLPDPPEGLRIRREITGDPALSNRGLAMLEEAGARRLVRSLGTAPQEEE